MQRAVDGQAAHDGNGGRRPPSLFRLGRGLEGPEPQKWVAMDFGVGDWKRPLVLAWLELPEDERRLPLSALARRYPPPRGEAL